MDSPFFPLYVAGLMVIGLLIAFGIYLSRRTKEVRYTSDLPIIAFIALPSRLHLVLSEVWTKDHFKAC